MDEVKAVTGAQEEAAATGGTGSASGILLPKRYCVLLICVPLAYMAYMAIMVLFRVPKLAYFQLQLKVEAASTLAQLLFRTYGFWWLLPLGVAIFTADIARRRRPSGIYVGAVLVVACVICWLMQAAITEGVLAAPLQITEMLNKRQ